MASDSNRHHERLTHDDRRDEILAAVRQTVVEDGLSRLSISAVASRAGCTRSLFYHYFPTKEDALQAVLDLSIDSFVEQLTAWSESRVGGDIEESLDSIAHMLKNMVVDQSDVMSQSVVRSGNAALCASFVHRAADRLARYMCSSTVVDFAAHHEVQIDHLYETFYVLITGLVMFVRAHPNAPEETVKDIIASTLHIEGHPAKYPERRPER